MKRTPLSRRTELRTLTPLQRSKPMPRTGIRPRIPGTSSPAAPNPERPRPRDTGPSAATRLMVLDRADGCCELCGFRLHDGTSWLAVHSVHHRRPRRMGGTTDPAANQPANLLLLCGSGVTGCHGVVESQRAMAFSHGWVLGSSDDPARVLVDLHITPPGHRARLDNDGRIYAVTGDSTWRLR